MAAGRTSLWRSAPHVVFALLLGAILLGVFARVMNYDLSRDEELYVPPAALLGDFRLYDDFFYNHVPGSAWLYHLFYGLFGAGGLLFSARLAVFVAWAGLAAAVMFFSWRLAGSLLAAAALTVLVLTNEQLLSVVGSTASNNFAPLPLAYVGLCLFILGVAGRGLWRDAAEATGVRRPNAALIFAAGGFLAAAMSIKVSAVAFVAPVALASLLMPAGAPLLVRLTRVAAPLAAGGLLVALPVLVLFLRAPEQFLAHVVEYHRGPHVAYWAADPAGEEGVVMGLAGKVLLAQEIWFAGGTLILCLVAAIFAALFAVAAGPARSAARDPDFRGLVLAAATMALVFAIGFAPTPSFSQYFAPPIIVAPIIIAILYGRLEADARARAAVIAVAAIFALAAGAPRLVQHLPRLLKPDSLTVARVHRDGLAIRAALDDAGVEGKVATLLPIYPLEGGLPVYPEFATGQFVYRTAKFTAPDLLKHYRTTSETAVKALFAKDPPAAFLVGFDKELEAPFVEFAADHGYRPAPSVKIKNRYGDGTLLVRAAPG